MVNGTQYKSILGYTMNILLAPFLDLRATLIDDLNHNIEPSTSTTDQTEVADSEVAEALENDHVAATALAKAKHEEQREQANQTSTTRQFHAARLHAALDGKTINGIIHSYQSAKIKGSSAIEYGSSSSFNRHRVMHSLLQLIETTLFFGMFAPEKNSLLRFASVDIVCYTALSCSRFPFHYRNPILTYL